MSCLIACLMLWPTDIKVEEALFQSVHVVDTIQTINIRHTPNCYERESRWAIGSEPSASKVIAFMAAGSLSHLVVTDWLVRSGHPNVARMFEGLTIGWSGHDVVGNYRLGIRL